MLTIKAESMEMYLDILTLLHSEQPQLYGVLAILRAVELNCNSMMVQTVKWMMHIVGVQGLSLWDCRLRPEL